MGRSSTLLCVVSVAKILALLVSVFICENQGLRNDRDTFFSGKQGRSISLRKRRLPNHPDTILIDLSDKRMQPPKARGGYDTEKFLYCFTGYEADILQLADVAEENADPKLLTRIFGKSGTDASTVSSQLNAAVLFRIFACGKRGHLRALKSPVYVHSETSRRELVMSDPEKTVHIREALRRRDQLTPVAQSVLDASLHLHVLCLAKGDRYPSKHDARTKERLGVYMDKLRFLLDMGANPAARSDLKITNQVASIVDYFVLAQNSRTESDVLHNFVIQSALEDLVSLQLADASFTDASFVETLINTLMTYTAARDIVKMKYVKLEKAPVEVVGAAAEAASRDLVLFIHVREDRAFKLRVAPECLGDGAGPECNIFSHMSFREETRRSRAVILKQLLAFLEANEPIGLALLLDVKFVSDPTSHREAAWVHCNLPLNKPLLGTLGYPGEKETQDSEPYDPETTILFLEHMTIYQITTSTIMVFQKRYVPPGISTAVRRGGGQKQPHKGAAVVDKEGSDKRMKRVAYVGRRFLSNVAKTSGALRRIDVVLYLFQRFCFKGASRFHCNSLLQTIFQGIAFSFQRSMFSPPHSQSSVVERDPYRLHEDMYLHNEFKDAREYNQAGDGIVGEIVECIAQSYTGAVARQEPLSADGIDDLASAATELRHRTAKEVKRVDRRRQVESMTSGRMADLSAAGRGVQLSSEFCHSTIVAMNPNDVVQHLMSMGLIASRSALIEATLKTLKLAPSFEFVTPDWWRAGTQKRNTNYMESGTPLIVVFARFVESSPEGRKLLDTVANLGKSSGEDLVGELLSRTYADFGEDETILLALSRLRLIPYASWRPGLSATGAEEKTEEREQGVVLWDSIAWVLHRMNPDLFTCVDAQGYAALDRLKYPFRPVPHDVCYLVNGASPKKAGHGKKKKGAKVSGSDEILKVLCDGPQEDGTIKIRGTVIFRNEVPVKGLRCSEVSSSLLSEAVKKQASPVDFAGGSQETKKADSPRGAGPLSEAVRVLSQPSTAATAIIQIDDPRKIEAEHFLTETPGADSSSNLNPCIKLKSDMVLGNAARLGTFLEECLQMRDRDIPFKISLSQLSNSHKSGTCDWKDSVSKHMGNVQMQHQTIRDSGSSLFYTFFYFEDDIRFELVAVGHHTTTKSNVYQITSIASDYAINTLDKKRVELGNTKQRIALLLEEP